MYDRDGLKRNYIMWKPSQKWGSKKIGKEKRERVTVALSVVLSFRSSNSSPQTNISSSFMCDSMFVHIWNPY